MKADTPTPDHIDVFVNNISMLEGVIPSSKICQSPYSFLQFTGYRVLIITLPREEQLKISRKEFQKPETLPKILIVTDMLLTGFDAPIERVMYLDKPLRDHKLLQAIARTNRPYEGKDSALIVDYVGIFPRLKEALNFEKVDIEGVAQVLDELKKEFVETIEKLRGILEGIPKENTRESIVAVIKLLTNDETREKFKVLLARAKALFETIAPDPYLSPYLSDYAWFVKCNEVYNKHIRAGKESLKPYQAKTEKLIRETVILKDIDKSFPTFEIGPKYLEKIEGEDHEAEYEVAELRQAIRYYIRINIMLNPALESLSEKLERIISSKDPEQMRLDLRALVEEINALEAEIKEKGLTREEHALLVVTQSYLDELPEKELIEWIKGLNGALDDSRIIFKGWTDKSETRKNVRRTVFSTIHRTFKDTVESEKIIDLTYDLMDYIERFHSGD